MSSSAEEEREFQPTSARPPRRKRRDWLLSGALLLCALYLAAAYAVLPGIWASYAHFHPALDDVPGITITHTGIPGDPINVALIGTREELIRIMLLAKWSPADPITLKSSLRIAADTIFRREYVDAPVSSLFLFGRKEDLAFELPVGKDPKQRNHVRFWESQTLDTDGRPFWLGAATFDERVGFSHTTGEITHHIDGNIDRERDRLFTDLTATNALEEVYTVTGFHKNLKGKNGGGDPWWTDGNLTVGVIALPSNEN